MGGESLAALSITRRCRIVAVGDQEIADRVRHERLKDRFLELRLPARPAEIDLELVAVRCREKLALSVSGRVSAPVVIGAIVRRVLRGRHLGRVHRQLGGERLGFLARFLNFPI